MSRINKIPRKLKKELKKKVLYSFSEKYKRTKKITAKKVRILYINELGSIGFDIDYN